LKRRHCIAACLACAGAARGQAARPLPVGIAFDEGSLPTMYRAGAQAMA
jgi:hypothetical protein